MTNFDNSFRFFLINTDNYGYILSIKLVSNYEYEKIRFSLSGVVLDSIRVRLLEENVVERSNGNTKYLKHNGIVLNKIQDIKLYPTAKLALDENSIDNPNIGLVDTVTYLNSDKKYKIYTLDF